MPTLLHVDVSPRGAHSVSRRLTAAFTEEWKAKHPGGSVDYLDLAATQPPYVDVQWIGGAFSAPDQHTPEQKSAIGVSDKLVNQLLAADEIVIGTPMYNFAVPAVLKAWIDHVIRAGKTFKYTENGPVGLIENKKMTILLASGGNYAPGSDLAFLNHEAPYLQTVFGFIGFKNVNIIQAGGAAAINSGKISLEEFLVPHIKAATQAAAQ